MSAGNGSVRRIRLVTTIAKRLRRVVRVGSGWVTQRTWIRPWVDASPVEPRNWPRAHSARMVHREALKPAQCWTFPQHESRGAGENIGLTRSSRRCQVGRTFLDMQSRFCLSDLNIRLSDQRGSSTGDGRMQCIIALEKAAIAGRYR